MLQSVYMERVPSSARLDAERFCFAVTIVNVVPYIVAALVLFYAAAAVLLLPFTILQAAVDVGAQCLTYVHISAPSMRKATAGQATATAAGEGERATVRRSRPRATRRRKKTDRM